MKTIKKYTPKHQRRRKLTLEKILFPCTTALAILIIAWTICTSVHGYNHNRAVANALTDEALSQYRELTNMSVTCERQDIDAYMTEEPVTIEKSQVFYSPFESDTEPVLPDEPGLPPEPVLPPEPDEPEYPVRDDIINSCGTGNRLLKHEYQIAMQKNCEKLGNIEYPFAIALADVESDFNPDAYSSTNDISILQVNEIHRPYAESLGYNLDDPEDNIAFGLLLISGHVKKTDGDYVKALMRYNNGPGGAAKLWKKGIYSTNYTKAVMNAYDYWKTVLAA